MVEPKEREKKRHDTPAPQSAEHAAWLAEMEAKSRAKQESFMNGIAERLRHPRMFTAPEHPYRGAPDFWRELEWSAEERIKQFTDNYLSVGAHVERLATMADASRFIADKALEMKARYLIRQDQQELADLQLEQLLAAEADRQGERAQDETAQPAVQVRVWNSDAQENWRARAAESDIGVVLADHAVAYTGSVVVLSDRAKGRSVSLLPTVLMIIVPVKRIVTRLGEVLTPFDEAGREQLPAGIHFITGPSRSSDIENDLTIGVHGPGVVYALLVDE